MKVWKRVLGACVLTGAVAGGAGAVEAGSTEQPPPIGSVELEVIVIGPEAENIDEDWYPELYEDGSNVRVVYCGDDPASFDEPLVSGRLFRCPVTEPTTFTLGFPTPPELYTVDWFCHDPFGQDPTEQFTDESATFTIDGDGTTDMFCRVTLSTHMLFLDKLFPFQFQGEFETVDPVSPDPVGGAEHGDFTLEAYAGSELAGSGVDADARRCGGFGDVAEGRCVVIPLPDGEYVLGESFVPGYQLGGVECEPTGSPYDERREIIGEDLLPGQPPGERFEPSEATTVFLGGEVPGDSVYCSIVNDYYEGSVTLTKTITNDDGGTAELGDFTLELYRAADGTLVDSGVCQADGVCLDGDYPIDDYVVGEVGPDGYTRTVTQEILLPSEQLTDTEAAFTLEPFAEVTVNVASDDDPPPPTTTTTVAPTTTQGPTTTAIDAGVVTLPATGSSSNAGTLAAVAALLMLLGAGATLVTRRKA